MRNSFRIECFQDSPQSWRSGSGYALVAIDVIRATTTAITAVAMGRRCFPVPSLAATRRIQRTFANALLAGEVWGNLANGFEINNSPAELSSRSDVDRPLVLLSSSGTKLLDSIRQSEFAYLACFRNYFATARQLVERHTKVLLVGAGTRGEFREEDQICCAWIARELMQSGYEPEDERTRSIADRWRRSHARECLISKSVEYLRRSGQMHDLDFILAHVNDLNQAYLMKGGEVLALGSTLSVTTHLAVSELRPGHVFGA